MRELVRACLAPSFPGTEVPDWIRRFLAGGGGAIVLFSYNVRDRGQLARLCVELQRERGDVLLAIDEEGGDVTRLEAVEGSSTPGNAGAFAMLRTVPNTWQPRSANLRAATRPMPDETPVTTTTVECDISVPR